MKGIEIIRNALTAYTERVHHYEALQQDYPYIVFSEDSGSMLAASNKRAETKLYGTVDLYTENEDEPLFKIVEAALAGCECSFYLNNIQYGKDVIHYEWAWCI